MPSERLVEDFARRDPDRFAAVCAHGAFDELMTVLGALPAETAVAVTARLPAEAFERLTSERAGELRGWLDSATFDDAVALIVRLSRHEATLLVDEIDNRKLRHRLRQFMIFPEHCVGAIVTSVALQAYEDTPVADVLAELRRIGGSAEIPAVVLNASGRLVGKLDLWKLLMSEVLVGTAGDFVAPIPMLHPETSLASAKALPYWSEHQWLPVVDGEHRLLGAASRRQVAEDVEAQQSSLLLEGIADLVGQFYGVGADLLSRVLGGRSGS